MRRGRPSRACAPRRAWREVFADDDPLRYESLPSNARRQGERLILDLGGRQGALDLPVLVAIGADDVTVDADAARRWFCTSPDRVSVLDGAR